MSVKTSSVRHVSPRRLAERRRRQRRGLYVFFIALAFLGVGASIFGLWQSGVRVSQANISGVDASVAALAANAMRGTYFGIIPRNSTFFLPTGKIRASILATYPNVAAVSLARRGLTGLRITADSRTSLARWCGNAPDAPLGTCYLFDLNGVLFASTSAPSVATSSATSSLAQQPLQGQAPLDPFILYEPIASSTAILGSTLPNASEFPHVFAFAQRLASFGSAVQTIAIENGEVDDTLASGTVVRYLLGDGTNAMTELVSAASDMNLVDGSLQYVDLRFSGKVYVKKKG